MMKGNTLGSRIDYASILAKADAGIYTSIKQAISSEGISGASIRNHINGLPEERKNHYKELLGIRSRKSKKVIPPIGGIGEVAEIFLDKATTNTTVDAAVNTEEEVTTHSTDITATVNTEEEVTTSTDIAVDATVNTEEATPSTDNMKEFLSMSVMELFAAIENLRAINDSKIGTIADLRKKISDSNSTVTNLKNELDEAKELISLYEEETHNITPKSVTYRDENPEDVVVVGILKSIVDGLNSEQRIAADEFINRHQSVYNEKVHRINSLTNMNPLSDKFNTTMKDLGFVNTTGPRSSHLKYAKGGQTIVFSKTPSDRRAMANNIAKLKRMLGL